jgi:hypothetical protein
MNNEHGDELFFKCQQLERELAAEKARADVADAAEKAIEELYEQAHEAVSFSDSNEFSVDMEVSAAIEMLRSERDTLAAHNAKLREALLQLTPQTTIREEKIIRDALSTTPADCAKELEELREDKKRLDAAEGFYIHNKVSGVGAWGVVNPGCETSFGNTLRQAIDAARFASQNLK